MAKEPRYRMFLDGQEVVGEPEPDVGFDGDHVLHLQWDGDSPFAPLLRTLAMMQEE